MTVSMSALSKFSTMNRPLGDVGGVGIVVGGAGRGGGATGGAAGGPGSGARGPTDTGGTGGGVVSVWTVTVVGDGTGPSGGVAIFGVGLRVAHPPRRESARAPATTRLTLLLRGITHAGW